MNRLGWLIQEALAAPPEDVRATIVDCCTCPVNILCLVGRGGNGWKLKCCGSTAVRVETLEGTPLTLHVDCAQNQFEVHRNAAQHGICSLCTDGALEGELRWPKDPVRWLPTVHAARPFDQRLAEWRKALPIVQARIALDAKVKERGKVEP